MILLSAVRGLALIGVLALPDAAAPVAAAGPVDLIKVLAGSPDNDSGQPASRLAFLGGGYVSGMHALQGAVQLQIEFRPTNDEETEWDVYLWFNDAGFVYVGTAMLNQFGDLLVEGENGDGWAYFDCLPAGGWKWTAFHFNERIGSGTMS